MEKRDARTNRLNKQIEDIKSELQHLSYIEQRQRDRRTADKNVGNVKKTQSTRRFSEVPFGRASASRGAYDAVDRRASTSQCGDAKALVSIGARATR